MASQPTPEIEAVQGIFAALNRNDLAAVLDFFDPGIVRIEPAGFATAGTYRGHAEVRAHLARGRGTWAEGSCEPERFAVAGDKVVAFLHVHVRLQGREDWIEGRFADVFTFRGGKAVEMRTFGEVREALAWAGVDPGVER